MFTDATETREWTLVAVGTLSKSRTEGVFALKTRHDVLHEGGARRSPL